MVSTTSSFHRRRRPVASFCVSLGSLTLIPLVSVVVAPPGTGTLRLVFEASTDGRSQPRHDPRSGATACGPSLTDMPVSRGDGPAGPGSAPETGRSPRRREPEDRPAAHGSRLRCEVVAYHAHGPPARSPISRDVLPGLSPVF